MKREDFGSDFIWGVGTSAYQIEGYPYADGAGESIWDRFCRLPGRIRHSHTGDRACEHYLKWEKDLDLVRDLNFPNYRFSTAWSRVLPNGTGAVNQAGLDYYNRLVDGCLERGIEPWVTLYHWDLPQILEDKGGWANREMLDWFQEYVALMANTLGDRVRNWMVLNEPAVFVGLGYGLGRHAPGKRDWYRLPAAIHHAALAQADGGRLLRELTDPRSRIGTTLSITPLQPVRNRRWHRFAVKRRNLLLNRLFLEPALGLGYPVQDFTGLRALYRLMQPGDPDRLMFNFDFLGVQNYTRQVVRFSAFPPYLWSRAVDPEKQGVPTSSNGWEVNPESLYSALKFFTGYTNCPPLLVSENGVAFRDIVQGERVHDSGRVAYFREALAQIRRVQQEGQRVMGYMAWTLMDNFEWADGYDTRFGLVYVDFEQQKRLIKDSGYWFQSFLERNP